MFSPLHDEISEAVRELRAKQDEITGVIGRLEGISAEATTKDRAVRAVVDSRGRLTELAFTGKRWRDMAPKELGAKIVEVVAEAREKAAEAAGEAMAGIVPAGMGGSGPDIGAMVEAAIADAGRWRR